MYGRAFQVVDWSIGNAVGFFTDDDPDHMLPYLTRVLLAANDASIDVEACPAALAELPFPEPSSAKERKRDKVLDKVVPALILNPATVDELGDALGVSRKLVRIAVERLKARRLLMESKHGLLFLKASTR